jgi:hypothetical protein
VANDTINITINYVGLDGEVHRGTTKRDMYISPGFKNPENGEYYGEEFLRNGKKKIRIITKEDFHAPRGERPGLRDKKPTSRANRKVRKNTSSPSLIPACCFIFFVGLIVFLVDPRTVDPRLGVGTMITGLVLLILAILQKRKEKKSALQSDRKKVSGAKVQVESSSDISKKQSANWADTKTGRVKSEEGFFERLFGVLFMPSILCCVAFTVPLQLIKEINELFPPGLVDGLAIMYCLLPAIIVFYKTEEFFEALKWAAGTLVSVVLVAIIGEAIFGKSDIVRVVMFYVPLILSIAAYLYIDYLDYSRENSL